MPTFAYPQGILGYAQNPNSLCTKNKSFASFYFVLHINAHALVRKEIVSFSFFFQTKEVVSVSVHEGVKKMKNESLK
jgi:hypothetical protein